MGFIEKYLQLSNLEIISVVSLLVLLLITVFYYRFYYGKPLKFQIKHVHVFPSPQPGVSVIIVAKDNYDELKNNLPFILEQNYPDFEVIIVNIGFTEETHNLIQELKLKYPNLYDTFLPYEPLEKKADRKKLALTLGIKAAKKEVLLFTEAEGKPQSKEWISLMMNNMIADKDVVVGYSYYSGANGLWRCIARFDNLIYSLQYLSSAIMRKPYTGTYRNLAYRKELFFNNKGFSSSLNYEHSEGIFLNRMMNSENVAVSTHKDSFISAGLDNPVKWRNGRIYSYKIKKHFKKFKFQRNQFYLETISRYLFYTFFTILLVTGIINNNWVTISYSGLLLAIKLAVQIVTVNKSAKHFESGKFAFSFILVELLQPLYNLYFKILSSRKRSKL